MSTATSPVSNRKSSANGEKPSQAETAPAVETPADKPESAETAETRGRGRPPGVIPTMPYGVVYAHGGRFHAGIFHPIDGSSYIESGKGEGSAKGALEDSGFKLGPLTKEGPEWLTAKLPSDARILGYASIKSFPLPKQ